MRLLLFCAALCCLVLITCSEDPAPALLQYQPAGQWEDSLSTGYNTGDIAITDDDEQ